MAWNTTGTVAQNNPGEPTALSVSQAVELASGALEAIPQLCVLGEVTGFRGPNARSGHCYFQIKDEKSSVDCIIWKGTYAKRTFDLRDGMQLNLTGSFNLYKATGKMSFVARSFSLAGEGLLRQQVAELAEKLSREGLMDASRKRRIPAFCTNVAVVTSLSGAVIDDVKRTLRRRNPLVKILCVGAKVQGEGAPQELIHALERVGRLDPAPDCVLLVRGGGSFEDLMTFNDEKLARAVASCPVPVVTGIGHEPDTSICDMVSDRRCSTPTAAAESVAPSMAELAELLRTRTSRLARFGRDRVDVSARELDQQQERLVRAMRLYLDGLSAELEAQAARPCMTRPDAPLRLRAQELSLSADRLDAARVHAFDRFTRSLDALTAQMPAPATIAAVHVQALASAQMRLAHAGSALVSAHRSQLASQAAKLDALSPLKVLGRGYSIAYANERVAARAASMAPGDALRIRMADGDVYGTVERVEALGSSDKEN